MKKFIFLALLSGIVLFSCASNSRSSVSNSEPSKEQLPNIIFIISDDHAYQAISAYGSKLIETPNIDRLAEEGMLFERAYVTNSICAPSRAVILTGKMSHLNGIQNNSQVFDSTQVTLPKLLKNTGYETAVIGKWHLKSEPTGFDYWRVLLDQGQYYHPEFRTPNGQIKTEGYVTDVVINMAINYLDSIRNPTKPFMMLYQHKASHRQWWPSMEDIEHINDMEYPIPGSLFDDYKHRGSAAKEAEMRIKEHMGLTGDNKIHPEIVEKLGYKEFYQWYIKDYEFKYGRFHPDEKRKWDSVYDPINYQFEQMKPEGKELVLWKYQRYMQDYLGTIKSLDRNIGRLLDYLEEHDLLDNTIIVYTSDQGFYLGEHGWFDKRFMYEESFRTPLIIRYPKMINPGKRNSDLVQNLDFAPTMLDIAGSPIPKDMQGESMVPLFKEDNGKWRHEIYYQYYEYPGIHAVKRHYGIRTDRYKLIHFYYDIDEWELYDLETDPQEMNNVYDDPKYADVKSDMHRKLIEIRKKYKDSDSLDQAFLKRDLKK